MSLMIARLRYLSFNAAASTGNGVCAAAWQRRAAPRSRRCSIAAADRSLCLPMHNRELAPVRGHGATRLPRPNQAPLPCCGFIVSRKAHYAQRAEGQHGNGCLA